MSGTQPSPEVAILGAVLVGGDSRRMGRDKAQLPFHGRCLAVHVAEILGEVLPDVVMVAREEDDTRFPGWTVIADHFQGAGPLAGLHAALLHTKALGGGGRPVFLAACDLPGLCPDLVRHVARNTPAGNARSEGPWARVPRIDGRLQPLAALYSPQCLPVAEEHLKHGRRAMHRFLEALEVIPLPLTSDLPFFRPDLLTNLNFPEDYRRMAEQGPPPTVAAGARRPS